MPRNGSGTYSLPAGNPVTSGTLIEASWANTTLSDLSSAMTDSLARSGEGGMTGPLRSTDGSVSVPSLSFVNETSTGFYRAAATDVRFAMAGVDIATLTTGGLTVGSSKILSLPDGSAAAPALTNTGDTNTGVFFPDADTVAVSTGGTERMRLTSGGNLLLSSSAARIQGDFSNATVGNRTFFQDKTTNNATSVGAIPNGTGAEASVAAFGVSDSANSPYLTIASGSNYTKLESGKTGTASYAPLTFNVGGAEAAQFNTSGNFVITKSAARIQGDFSNGTLANRASFQTSTSNDTTAVFALPNGSSQVSGWYAFNNSAPTNAAYVAIDTAGGVTRLVSAITGSGTALPLTVNVGSTGTEAARFATTGQFLVGTDNASFGASSANTKLIPTSASNVGIATGNWNNVGSAIDFYANIGSGVVYSGSVAVSGATTSYNSASDYRLKSNPQPLTGSGAFIDALQPKTWTWVSDGAPGAGFIAHEVATVSPRSVCGEKDAVNDDGSPKYQSMEYGSAEFIANIVAELQSLRARVAALEAA